MTPDQLWSDLRSMQYHIEHKKDKIFGRYFFQYLTQINHQANNNTFREHQYPTIKSWCHNKTHSFAIHLCKSLLLNNKHTCKARALSSVKTNTCTHSHYVTIPKYRSWDCGVSEAIQRSDIVCSVARDICALALLFALLVRGWYVQTRISPLHFTMCALIWPMRAQSCNYWLPIGRSRHTLVRPITG